MAADRAVTDVTEAWPITLPLNDVARGPVDRRLVADEATRGRIATLLDLVELPSLEARLHVEPWLDGAQVSGRWSATVVQICGVTLEPFETALKGELNLRAVPIGSPALASSAEHELDIDPEADDPPDALESDALNLGAYVVEDLSLAVDPFPRKPGVEFELPSDGAEPSPFAVLAQLKTPRRDS